MATGRQNARTGSTLEMIGEVSSGRGAPAYWMGVPSAGGAASGMVGYRVTFAW